MVEFTITTRCALIIIGGVLSLRDVNVAHSFLAPESYYMRRQLRQISSCGGGSSIIPTTRSILLSSSKSSSTRPGTTTKSVQRIDNEELSTTTAVSSAKSKEYNFSQLVDDVWANEGGGTSTSSSLSSSTIDNDVNEIQDTSASSESTETTKWILIGGTTLVLAAAWGLAVTMGNELGINLKFGELMKDPSSSLETILKSLETMDAQKGMIYFSSFYILAEILAIPAVPILTASSGYLFGLLPGTATCLFSAVIAASISFVIGRTCLRGYVEGVLADNPKFRAMDRAIDKGGFKLMLITRLSPLFPFALSNYLFGASSIQFPNYFFGTLFGFLPGTFAYVYAGSVGKALTIDSASSKPWYIYLAGMAVIIILLKIAGDVASGVIDSMEDEAGEGWDGDAGIS